MALQGLAGRRAPQRIGRAAARSDVGDPAVATLDEMFGGRREATDVIAP